MVGMFLSVSYMAKTETGWDFCCPAIYNGQDIYNSLLTGEQLGLTIFEKVVPTQVS